MQPRWWALLLSLHYQTTKEIVGIITVKTKEDQVSAATEPILQGDGATYTDHRGSNDDLKGCDSRERRPGHWISTTPEPSKLTTDTGKEAIPPSFATSGSRTLESSKLAIDCTPSKKGKKPMRLNMTPQDTTDENWVFSANPSISARHDKTQKTTREPLHVTQTKRSTIACTFCRDRRVKVGIHHN